MARILITAENFAFGPIGKVLVIANLLKKNNHELSFAGFGTSLQLARKFPFKEIHEVDTDEESEKNKIKKIISKYDLLISSMDIPSINIAKEINKPSVWIDCLFWFWDYLPENVLNADLFIKENLFDDQEKGSKHISYVKNLISVGPIIGEFRKKIDRKQILISYGGAEATHSYKIGKDTNYPHIMTKILLKHIDFRSFDRAIIATNENAILDLKKKFSNKFIDFQCLPYDDFIQEIANSEILLSTPGLVTAEIAFEVETPIIFLPASNNSQYMQLDKFRNLYLAPASIHISDYLPRLNLDSEPIEESTQLVLEQLRLLEDSTKLQSKIGNRINYLMDNKEVWGPQAVKAGKEYITERGGNGAQKAIKEINSLINRI